MPVPLAGGGKVEVEGYVYVGGGIGGGEGGGLVDTEEGAGGGVVHGAIAAGSVEANIFEGAVAKDAEGGDGMGAARGADGGIDGGLDPVLADGALDGFNVPAIARGEIAAARAGNGEAAGGCAGSLRVAGGDVDLAAAFAVGDGVWRRRLFGFEDFGFFGGRWRRLFFLELENGRGIGLGLFDLGLFFGQAFRGIDDLTGCGHDWMRHGNAGAADEIYLYAGLGAATDASPGIAGALDPDAEGDCRDQADVQPSGIAEKALEGGVVAVGGVTHGVRTFGSGKLASGLLGLRITAIREQRTGNKNAMDLKSC